MRGFSQKFFGMRKDRKPYAQTYEWGFDVEKLPNRHFMVSNVHPDSMAAKFGIQSGWRITKFPVSYRASLLRCIMQYLPGVLFIQEELDFIAQLIIEYDSSETFDPAVHTEPGEYEFTVATVCISSSASILIDF